MRVVYQGSGGTFSVAIPEFRLAREIERIRGSFVGFEERPRGTEVFRYRLPGGVIVVHGESKAARATNEWYEERALSALARELGTPFRHRVKLKDRAAETEVDGVSLDGELMVEAKNARIDQDWIDYYQSKAERLGFKRVVLLAREVDLESKPPSNVDVLVFHPDWEAPYKHYQSFNFPGWLRNAVPSRHFRFLLQGGGWLGAKRSLTRTAKHTPESKLRQILLNIHTRQGLPVKVYYSMARMVNPPAEYRGRGYPVPRLLAVLDIDPDPHQHVLDGRGFCQACLDLSGAKADEAEAALVRMGYQTRRVYSGRRGFHVYLIEDGAVKEVNLRELMGILEAVGSLTDSRTFKSRDQSFDQHRVIKVPNTFDASTGMLVDEKASRLPLKDTLEPFQPGTATE